MIVDGEGIAYLEDFLLEIYGVDKSEKKTISDKTGKLKFKIMILMIITKKNYKKH